MSKYEKKHKKVLLSGCNVNECSKVRIAVFNSRFESVCERVKLNIFLFTCYFKNPPMALFLS